MLIWWAHKSNSTIYIYFSTTKPNPWLSLRTYGILYHPLTVENTHLSNCENMHFISNGHNVNTLLAIFTKTSLPILPQPIVKFHKMISKEKKVTSKSQSLNFDLSVFPFSGCPECWFSFDGAQRYWRPGSKRQPIRSCSENREVSLVASSKGPLGKERRGRQF